MEKTKVKITLLNDKVMAPYKPFAYSREWQLFASDPGAINTKKMKITYKTGIRLEIPEGFIGWLAPSDRAAEAGLSLVSNTVQNGQEIFVTYRFSLLDALLKEGDIVCKLLLIPVGDFELEYTYTY